MPVDQLGEADLPQLQALARACLDADGGLPLFTTPGLLSARLLREHTVAIREDGRLLAAAGLGMHNGRAITSGLVAPTARRRGLGSHLMAWAEDLAGNATLVVATESCSADAEHLSARTARPPPSAAAGLPHAPGSRPRGPPPPGGRVTPVDKNDATHLYAAYVGSFADRPGFTAPTAAGWLDELRSDGEWRRDLSLLATVGGEPVGFVNVLGRWVDQIGVVPQWRGRRLGAHLMARTLQALAVEGVEPVWLCVNVDNPAEALYGRLGFAGYGTRARYQRQPGPAGQRRLRPA